MPDENGRHAGLPPDQAGAVADRTGLTRTFDQGPRRQIAHHFNTVQDHLKSIFDKTGVGSRRKLVVTILQDQVPAAGAGRAPAQAVRLLRLVACMSGGGGQLNLEG